MNIQDRLRIYIKRNPSGSLYFPLCVKAHIAEIEEYEPNAITENDRRRIFGKGEA